MNEKKLREELAKALDWRRAHLNLEDVVEQVPDALRSVRPAGAPHSPWQLLEHLRICQSDIVEFCRDSDHQSPPFPEGYWPKAGKAEPGEWRKSLERFRGDLENFRRLLLDPQTDLFSPSGEDGPSILHEAILLIDHNAYHLGQLVLMLRLAEVWRGKPIDY